MNIIIQIFIAALALLGFYFAFKVLSSSVFGSKGIAATVVIDSAKQISMLDLLLKEASAALFAARCRNIAVLIPESLWIACDENDKSFAKEMINTFGAKLYFINPYIY